jgi:hypothetical protein
MIQSPCYNRKIIPGLIACLLLAGIPAAMAADGTNTTSPVGGMITAITYPAGAAVSLNGEYRGVTPIQLANLSPGKYQVDISMAGYRNETVRRTLSEGSMLEIGINLELISLLPAPIGSGSIAVDSNPGGAAVLLDGKPAGTTPLSHTALILNTVPIGNHTVTVELAGYPSYTSTVTILKNQVVIVNADFVTRSPTTTGTPVATTDRQKQVPLSPLPAIAAAGLVGLAAVFRRS